MPIKEGLVLDPLSAETHINMRNTLI